MTKEIKEKKEEGTYARFTRVLGLAVKMFGRALTKDEICQIMRCSKRTADRIINCFDDVYKGGLERNTIGGKTTWTIRGNQTLPKQLKADEEDIYLLNALADLMVKQGRNEDGDRLTKLRAALVQALSQKDREWDGLDFSEGNVFRPGIKAKIDPEIVKTIRRSIQEKKLLNIEYFNKKSGKISEGAVEPYGILYNDRTQYLLARYADNYFGNEIHHFILSNIKYAMMTDAPFKGVDFDMNEYTKDSFGVYREEPYDVEWKFSAKAAPEAENFVFHPDQETIKNKDGSLTVKFRAGGTLEMAWHLYTWGKEVKVVKPRNFWKRVELEEQNRWS